MFPELVVVCVFHLHWNEMARKQERNLMHLMKIVLVQLPDEAGEIGVLEHARQD